MSPPLPATVPLRQFAQAYCRGWELHRIGAGWWAVQRDDRTAFQRLRPFPACHADLPSDTRKLFAEVHSDHSARRMAVSP